MALPREYYTIEQAAIKLTETFAENVSVDDVKRFIEAEHIIPTFRLNRVQATPGTTLYNFSPGKMKYHDVRVQSADCQIPLEGMFSPFNLKLFFDNGGHIDICRKGFVIPALYEIYDEKFSSYLPTETPTYLVVEPCVISVNDMLIAKRELQRFEAANTTTAPAHSVNTDDVDNSLEVAEVKRHTFTPEQRTKADKKGCLQYAVESYLDKNVDGQWGGFKKFLEAKLKLPKEEILCKEQSYNFYFDKLTNTTLFLKPPKRGKKEGEQGWNQHSADSVGAVIRTEKRKRKKQTE